MDTHKNSGFTIIEVIMFLAISSLLGIGVLATASASINTQRYQDSVRSFYSQLQSEYSQVINVENSRTGSQFSCQKSGKITDASEGAAQPRGTSDCLIVGRVIDVSGDATVVHSEPVYATVNVLEAIEPPVSDEAALQDSKLIVASPDLKDAELNRTDYKLEWQTQLVDPKNNPQTFRLLVVRSPLSGMVRTYAATGPGLPELGSPSAITGLIGQTREVTACISPSGLFSGLRQKGGVTIAARASSTAGLSMTRGDACQA